MISHKHKFIFIHIPKCGGTTVEKALGWDGAPHHTMEWYMKQNYDSNPDEYYKFTFVRNPWDRLVSWYFYCRTRGLGSYPKNFEEWVQTGIIPHWETSERIIDGTKWRGKDPINYQSWITHEKQYDFIGKLENFQQDFNIVCEKIGIPQQQLRHTNKSNHKHYTEYYDDETREIVAEKYARDIERFGYKFGE